MSARRVPSGEECRGDQVGCVAACFPHYVFGRYSRVGCSGHTLLNEFRYRNIHVAGKWMGPHMQVYPLGDKVHGRWPFPWGQVANSLSRVATISRLIV